MKKIIKNKKIPLRIILVAPFLLQIMAAVGLVGYLSYRSGQQGIKQLARLLTIEVSNRVNQHLNHYLGTAQSVNLSNLNAFDSGVMNLNDFQALGEYFYDQLHEFGFSYVNFGSQDGSFIGAGYTIGNKLEIAEISNSNLSQYISYSVDDLGHRTTAEIRQNPGVSNSPWYLDAVDAGKPVWSSIYTWQEPQVQISISASAPAYDQNEKLLGVFGIDLNLNHISQFLKTIDIGRSGQIFIVERSGLVVANLTA